MTLSPQVKKLQSFLKRLNYFTLPYTTDYFGPLTKEALQDFQKDNNIQPASGIFGKITASYIDNNCAKLKSREYFERLRQKEKEEKEKKKEESNTNDTQDLKSYQPAVSRTHTYIAYKREEILQEGKESYANLKRSIQNISPLKATKEAAKLWYSGIKLLYNDYIKGDEKTIKLYYFKIASKNTNKYQSDPNKNTYILIHGYLSEPSAWAQDFANHLQKINPNSQILLLDWKEITANLNIKADSKKIPSLAKELSITLDDWKLNPSKTTIIGHSLGSILAAKLSNQIYQRSGKQVQELVALDPASVMDYGLKSFQESNAKTSRCFVGDSSELGDEGLASSCDRSYIMQFKPKLNMIKEHSGVIEQYKKILQTNGFGKDEFLKLHNNNDTFPKTFRRFFADNFNGIIDILVSNSGTYPNFLQIKQNPKVYKFIGNKLNNRFLCRNTKYACVFEGYTGKDTFSLSRYDLSSESPIIVSDLSAKGEGDKIEIGKYLLDKIDDSYKVKDYVALPVRYYYQQNSTTYVRNILIKNVDVEDVRGWVEIATLDPKKDTYFSKAENKLYSGKELEILQGDNPIQIR